ncbi:DUF4439 domain-containing protein [Nocardioides sp. GCM10027113]|uniref:DUF4439 domain-containing protein n=1 Tax=unclassified Nocardioides TaxID=2615069 RepID=UPI00362142D6
MTTTGPTVAPGTEALQAALATEHRAVHVLGALGARTSATATPELHATLVAAYTAHRARRDQLARWIRDDGAVPVAASPTYLLPEGSGAPEAVATAAREVAEEAAGAYAWLVAGETGSRRRWAVGALTDVAVRVLAFRGSPEILPGIDEHADR